eukprot:symbB.v1.2.022006.t1/scaffold1935.1/size95652/1
METQALYCLREAAEQFLVGVMEDGYRCSIHAKRVLYSDAFVAEAVSPSCSAYGTGASSGGGGFEACLYSEASYCKGSFSGTGGWQTQPSSAVWKLSTPQRFG